MANIIADVQRLFINSAAFLAGSIRKQMGYDKTLKKLMIHNDTDDTLASEWSDDTKQVLIVGTQVVTGDKEFSGVTTHSNEVIMEEHIPIVFNGESPIINSIFSDTQSIGIATFDSANIIQYNPTLSVTDWASGGVGFVLSGSIATYTHGTGLDLISYDTDVFPTDGSVWCKLTYTISGISGAAASFSMVSNSTALPIVSGVNSVYVLTQNNGNSNGRFDIAVSSLAAGSFIISNILLEDARSYTRLNDLSVGALKIQYANNASGGEDVTFNLHDQFSNINGFILDVGSDNQDFSFLMQNDIATTNATQIDLTSLRDDGSINLVASGTASTINATSKDNMSLTSTSGQILLLAPANIDITSTAADTNIQVRSFYVTTSDVVDVNAVGSIGVSSNAAIQITSLTTVELQSNTKIDNVTTNLINNTFYDNSSAKLVVQNTSDYNGSIINNVELDFRLSQNNSSGSGIFDALQILVEKNAAWAASTLLSAGVIFKTRYSDGITSFMVPSLSLNGYAATLGDSTLGLASLDIKSGDGTVTLRAGTSGAGFNLIIGGVTFLVITDISGFVFTNQTMTLAAGTATLPPLKLISGTNTTTAAAGAIEFDGLSFNASPNASNRATIVTEHWRALAADVAFVNNNVVQPWFPAAIGLNQITLPASTSYFFRGTLGINGGATAHSIGISFGGTATITSIQYTANGFHGNVNTTVALGNNTRVNQVANTAVTAASLGVTTDSTVEIEGIIRINGAGTLIPQFTFSAAPGAGNVSRNTRFRMSPIGNDTVVSRGNWS